METEVEILKGVDAKLKGRLDRANKELKDASSALTNANEQYRDVAKAAAPLIGALAPAGESSSHEALVV